MKYNLLNDDQLVELLKKDNKCAFEEIYNRYWYKLYGIAYHQTGTKEEAEELVHDLFESIWLKRHQSIIRHLSAYLVVSIRHLTTNYIKSQINHRKFQEYFILHEIHETFSTEEIVDFKDLSFAIDEVMKKLPEKTCTIFKLSRFGNYSVKEISARLSLSEKTVEYHITKSLKLFKKHLKEHYINN
jgi:RNA polymerase sigma-70 factor (ECF subfamily)